MSPDEYRAALARLGLNQRQAGELLGYSLKASHAYASGTRGVPKPVECLLRICERLGVEKVRWLLSPAKRAGG